jgi:hypothetical protein
MYLPSVQPNLTRAILRYVGAPAVEPTTVDVPGAKLDDSLMHVRALRMFMFFLGVWG